MRFDMCGEPLNEGDWVAVNGSQRMKILRVCKITKKMIVVEYFTPKRRDRKTYHLYANDVIKISNEAVFRMELMR